MADESTVKSAADAAVAEVLENGQSSTMDGMSSTEANLRTAYEIGQAEVNRAARASGRRPLFKGISMSRMGY